MLDATHLWSAVGNARARAAYRVNTEELKLKHELKTKQFRELYFNAIDMVAARLSYSLLLALGRTFSGLVFCVAV